jgi:lipoprotein-anchoring transpeptidase ErfK/SrfK
MRRVLLITFALLLVPAAAAQAQEPRIPPGATAAGVDVGGLLLSEAAARLDQTFGAAMRRTVQVRVAGRGYRMTMRSIDFEFDAMKTARRANIAARATPPQPDGRRPVDVPLFTSWSAEKLSAFTVGVRRRSGVRARNATLHITLRKMITRKAKIGAQINAQALATVLAQTVANPASVRLLRAQRERVLPQVNTVDLQKRYATVITIDRGNFRLRLFKNLKFSKSYGVAVGAPGYSTPTGRFAIQNKAVNPTWTAPDAPWAGSYRGRSVEGGAADNPLKARWLGIESGVGIHGTAADYSIGTAASHGCIRMHVSDVIDLYDRVPVGTPVLIGN